MRNEEGALCRAENMAMAPSFAFLLTLKILPPTSKKSIFHQNILSLDESIRMKVIIIVFYFLVTGGKNIVESWGVAMEQSVSEERHLCRTWTMEYGTRFVVFYFPVALET